MIATIASARSFGPGTTRKAKNLKTDVSEFDHIIASSATTVQLALAVLDDKLLSGNDTEMLFNDSYDIGQDSDLTWNKTTNLMTISGTQERIIGTTNGEYIDFNDGGDDYIRFGGASGTSDVALDIGLDTNVELKSSAGDIKLIPFGDDVIITDGSVFWVGSAGDDKHVKLYHNDSEAIVASTSGNLKFLVSSNKFLVLSESSTDMFALGAFADTEETIVLLYDTAGNQFIFTNVANYQSDHDHATTTDPTLFIHSDKDPDTDNTEWISLTHDQTDAVIGAGSGDIKVGNTTSGFVPAKVTGDPCGSMQEGSIFYNDTSNYHCFCNDAGADIKMNDNTTACF